MGITFLYFTVQNGWFRDGSECYLARSLLFANVQCDRLPYYAHLPRYIFTSGDFILYCFDSVQLAIIARENFEFEEDVGLFIPEVVRSPLPDSK